MRTSTTLFSLAAVLLVATISSPAARADEGRKFEPRKRNRLDSEPAVRHRLLLVKNRFEVAPQFESTINADFRHTVGPGVKLEYHLTDMLSFGGLYAYGFSINTGLVDKIMPTLEP